MGEEGSVRDRKRNLSTVRKSETVAGLHSRPVAILGVLLLASIASPVLAGADRGLFSERVMEGERPGTPLPPAEMTLRSRSVDIDIGRLAEARDAFVRKLALTNDSPNTDGLAVTLLFNLFDDAIYTGVLERTGPTSAGYSLSGRIQEAELGTFDLVIHGEIVFGSVTTPKATFWIRSGPGIIYWVSEIDFASFPPEEELLHPDESPSQ